MRIGVPSETKSDERRVGLLPDSVQELQLAGHEVWVQAGAGTGVGADDAQYQQAGARVAASAQEIFARAELIVKVKEPQPPECALLREGQMLFGFLHLAPDAAQARALIKSGAVCIAYETVAEADGRLPLLAPMSRVAGRLAVQEGAYWLCSPRGGAGVLLGGVPGVAPARVVVVGGGVVGENAIEMAVGLGADVCVLDRDGARLTELAQRFGGALRTLHATKAQTRRQVRGADLVIGAVLVQGARAPHVVDADMVREMKAGAVVVDVSIDQGGCVETSRPTTHAEPVFLEHGVIHYCVANVPSAVATTATHALNNVTLPFVQALAKNGARVALESDPRLRAGLNISHGRVTHPVVAAALGYQATDPLATL